MTVFQKIINTIYSTRLMSIAVVLFAIAMAVATFVEDIYGTTASKAVIYNTKWFEVLMLILVINFIGNIFKYRLFRREKWPVFLFHISFIIILMGSFTTRYFGFEGVMTIREGEKSSIIRSSDTYINIEVNNGKIGKPYRKAVLFSNIGRNKYKLKEVFGTKEMEKKPFTVELLEFVPNVMKKLVLDDNGDNYLHIVESSSGARNDIFLKDGEAKSIQNIILTFNNPVKGGMNIFSQDGKLVIEPAIHGNVMAMQTQELTPVMKDSIIDLEFKKLYRFENLMFVVPAAGKGYITKESAPKAEQDKHPYDGLSFKVTSGGEEQIIDVQGVKGTILAPEKVSMNGLNFNVSYGAVVYSTPFELELRDFELERYPGTNSASSYASEVTVVDSERGKNFDHRIFMNHVLDYRGYRFFQSSFDKDEKGTLLSVNHDYWGTLITYWGYGLMGLGMFFTLFWKGTRFSDLSVRLKKIADKKAALTVLLLSMSLGLMGQAEQTLDSIDLTKFTIDQEHASKFGKLLVQDHKGRIKPINTYALEALRKVSGKDGYKGLTADQVILSAQVFPSFWTSQYIIKIEPMVLGTDLSSQLKVRDKKTSMINFFYEGNYFLESKIEAAFRKKKTLRNGTDTEVLNLDDRANVWLNVLQGSLMVIYPKKGDDNNKWFTGVNREVFAGADTMILKMHDLYMASLQNAVISGDYSSADEFLGMIAKYQQMLGSEIIPAQKRIDLEIQYNKWGVFKKLLFYYMLIGFIFMILAFFDLFKPNNKAIKFLLKVFSVLTIIGMGFHVWGLEVRWEISGHAPWSNGYEAMVFVAFITVLAGLIFSHKKSKFTLASTVIFASFLLGIAHGNLMNPEITNLVPVLKSYWLMVHVAIITASYGFLGLSSLLGFVVMTLFILRSSNNAKRLNLTIKELTYVSESTMAVGLFTLSLGTFLGGVWASESWGRYWSWDAKEVWALISMMVYIFILHMRLVPGLRGKFAFNFAGFWSISTLIMTFFGVNYYLSGMHSYATGDPVPIPAWVTVTVVVCIIFSIISYIRYNRFEKNK